ncbi:TonB-dependent hemoglobin/transferrin/lactoferrin family receptor [Labrys wisconsinensis]|uniref:Hemoglobin/transferrin/lactoferrin receptor protein n=1 Tax=Labrys wisconsinensis TaxID=425677 RepID=A0ABU0J5U0_9HYPH|nr:TonB-dependent hemoglobin/transferrin/lactoferrin family receptor [Labrys wisconsinensis]MDQ0469631.1 hemoglobin/transferrin/lactoferrin receptor protein [Labrys wisconsinensis]
MTALLVAGTGPVLAQQAAPTAAAAETAQPDGSQIILDAVTVTATKTEEKAIDVLGGASVVTGEKIRQIQPGSVSEILKDIPGVSSQNVSNDPMQSVNIRGLQDFGRVNVLVDGARQDYQISGHNPNGSFYLDPDFIGQADVTRGPIANIYGSGAIGGVVSLSTKTIDDILTDDENYGVMQNIGIGTNGAGVVSSTSAAARYGTVADFYGQFVYRNTNAYDNGAGQKVADSGQEILGGLFKANFRPAEGQTISLSALVQNFDYTNNGASGAGSRIHNDVDSSTYTIGYRFQRPEIWWLDLSAKAYFTQTKNVQTMLEPSATYIALGVQPGDKLSDRINTYGFDLSNTMRFSTSVLDHTLTYGLDGAKDEVEVVDNAGGYIGAFTPSGNRTLFGGFIQDEVRYGDWLRVLGGLRYDSYSLKGGSYKADGDRLSPKITVGITPIQGLEFYGTYAEGYRAPSVTETLIGGTHPFPAFRILPNLDLRPEVGHNLEGGVNAKYDNVLFDGDRFRAKATVFQNKIDDFIDMVGVGDPYLVPFIPGMPVSVCAVRPSLCFPIQSQQYVNVAKATISGVELEGAYDWQRGFVSIAATHTNGKNDVTGGPLHSVPPDRISTTLGFRFLDDALTVGGRWTLVDSSSGDPADPIAFPPAGGYGLVDLFSTYQYNEWSSAALSVNNLFDRKYRQYLDASTSPGLTVKFSLQVKLAAK